MAAPNQERSFYARVSKLQVHSQYDNMQGYVAELCKVKPWFIKNSKNTRLSNYFAVDLWTTVLNWGFTV